MTALLSPVARQLFLNPSTGSPAVGYKIFTYLAGTPNTKENTYTDSTGTTPNTNPIILDDLGEAAIWLSPSFGYKFVFAPPTDTDPPSNPIWTVDNIFGSSLTGAVSPWAIASGTSDVITAAYTPANTSLPDGLLLGVRFAFANVTATPTFQPDAQPAYVITEAGGQPLAVGACAGPLAEGLLRFNLAHLRWELLNPAVSNLASGANIFPAINAKMTLTTAGLTGTLTADLVTVATALNGQSYVLPSYSQALNLGTTGPGGMDTGSAPLSSFICIYAIYSPGTGTQSIMACAISTSSGTIYSGANLPAGYTASVLLAVWLTDGSGNMSPAALRDRQMSITATGQIPLTGSGAWISLGLSAVPLNALLVNGWVLVGNSSGSVDLQIAAFGAGSGIGIGEVRIGGGARAEGQFYGIPMATASTIYYKLSSGGTGGLEVTGYTF